MYYATATPGQPAALLTTADEGPDEHLRLPPAPGRRRRREPDWTRRRPPARTPARARAGARLRTPAGPALRAVADIGRHLLIPLFLATGMALAYLGAFHEPTPHQLPTAVVGTSVEAKVFAQKLNDGAQRRADRAHRRRPPTTPAG